MRMESCKLLKICKLVELQEPLQNLSSFLWNLICKSRPNYNMEEMVTMICPCNTLPATFHLLEEVEAALPLGTTRLIVGTKSGLELKDPLLSAISSRISRQQETVTSVDVGRVVINNKGNARAFTTLLQAEKVNVGRLEVGGTIEEEGWQLLARALFAGFLSQEEEKRKGGWKNVRKVEG